MRWFNQTYMDITSRQWLT